MSSNMSLDTADTGDTTCDTKLVSCSSGELISARNAVMVALAGALVACSNPDPDNIGPDANPNKPGGHNYNPTPCTGEYCAQPVEREATIVDGARITLNQGADAGKDIAGGAALGFAALGVAFVLAITALISKLRK